MAHTAIDIEFDRDRNLPRVVIARDYSGNVNITHFDDQNFPSELKESGVSVFVAGRMNINMKRGTSCS